jgi:hypothetical protein
MISLLLSEAKRLHQRLADGDPEARKFFLEAFHATALCWLCDEPIGPDGTNVTVQDPANPRMALIMPECISCRAHPERTERELDTLRACGLARKFGVSGICSPVTCAGRG